MNKNKNVEELLKDAKTLIMATDNGSYVVGSLPKVMTAYTMLTRALIEQCGKEPVEHAHKLACLSPDELVEEVKDKISDLLKKIKSGL